MLGIFGGVFVFSVIKLAGVVPLPWIDEVMYADPVFNWASGKGFTSGAWYSQPYGETWSSNSPLYAFLALPAVELFGNTVEVWRGFWAASFVASIILLVASSWKLRLIRSPVSIFIVGLIFIWSQSTSYLPAYGRGIDAACLVVVSVALGSLTYTSRYGRVIGLFVFGAAIPATGLQLGPSVAAVILCFMFARWKAALCAGIWVGAGIVSGIITVVVAYSFVGQAYEFTAMTFASEFTTVGSVTQSAVMSGADRLNLSRYDIFSHYLKMFGWDITLPFVFVSSLVASIVSAKSDGDNTAKTIALSSAGLAVIPIAMIFAGRFARYYYWMSLIPAVLSITSMNNGTKKNRYISVTLLSLIVIISTITGYVGKVYSKKSENNKWYDKVKILVEKNVESSDTVMVSEVAYFETIKKSRKVYTDEYSGGGLFKKIRKKDSLAIEKLVLRKKDVDDIVGGVLGRKWKPVDRCVSEDKQRSLIVFRRGTDNYLD